ncbi:MAG: tetratricopeptide repeat protein [Nitrospirae bacterium]|nr:tetratricopeptide repeat protein [Nitrospirota bacterium]
MGIENDINLALKELESGNFSTAENIYSSILLKDPSNPVILNNLGNLFKTKGEREKSIEYFKKALIAAPTSPELNFNLANMLYESGHIDEAVTHYKMAIALEPEFKLAYNNIAEALKEIGCFDEALYYLQQVLKIEPNYTAAHMTMGNIFTAMRRLDDALDSYHNALDIEPHNHYALYNMANIRKITGSISEAIDIYREALKLKPDYSDAWSNLGAAFKSCGNISEAITCYRKAIELSPDNEDAHLNYAIALLLSGNFEEGWQEYEWRLKTRNVYCRKNCKEWSGDTLNGETILLYADQGYGDTLQCARYIPMVKAMGAGKIILECQPELISLMRSIDCIDHISPRKSELANFDLCSALFSLPRIFNKNNIPASVPYLKADEKTIGKWSERIKSVGESIRVGLVWAGSPTYREDKFRSLDLKTLLPLLTLKDCGISFFSLQTGAAANEIMDIPENLRPIELSGEINDFSDTAAIMEQLSLIITVDTASAHLAGALGEPVWTLIPEDPDWRWLLERNDSPWYPTMLLFRKEKNDDWQNLILRLSTKLKKLIGTDGYK